MKTIGALIFALGIIIAISGGAKMPHVALTGSAFIAGLEADKFSADSVHDAWVGESAVTFQDRSDSDEGSAIAYKVRLASDRGESSDGAEEGAGNPVDERSQIIALLEQKSIAFNEVDPTASYATDPLAVPTFPSTWPLFAVGAAIGLVGLVLWRSGIRAEAAVTDDAEAEQDVHDPVTLLHQMVGPVRELQRDSEKLTHGEITTRIDDITEQYVLPFAEVRHVLLERFGTAAGAEILVTMAFAERMLNRTWSAAADEHLEEARNSIPEALAGIEEANRLVEKQTTGS